MPVTRLAPSPTGALHLGNARTFLVNWLMARQNGWRIVLRIEDLDGPRIKPGAASQLLEDLAWLGIDWDDGPTYQSSRCGRYAAALEELVQSGVAYPCICTRREVETAASAPHAEDGAAVYPGTCRNRFVSVPEAAASAGRPPALRFAVPQGPVEFTDEFAGRQQFDSARQLGDFVVAKADGTPAYQLAVVVDDLAMDVTHVVRGDDLLSSTPRQILLYGALGQQARVPTYWHLPLVVGPDGRRLAKRHGDTRLWYYRKRGVSAGRVLQLLAGWCGIQEAAGGAKVRRPADLLGHFNLALLPRQPIIFSSADEAFLISNTARVM